MQALAVAPAAPAFIAKSAEAAPPQGRAGSGPAILAAADPDGAAETVARFFTPPQFAALRRLSGLLQPAMKGNPGALDCGAPEFLDFLIGDSPADRQQLYRTGLDSLNAQSKKQFSKAFADLDDAHAKTIVTPMLVAVPWPKDPPKDALKNFMFSAREDIADATRNSPEFAAAMTAAGRRVGAGNVWKPIDPVYRG
jgi:hypothetical protein